MRVKAPLRLIGEPRPYGWPQLTRLLVPVNLCLNVDHSFKPRWSSDLEALQVVAMLVGRCGIDRPHNTQLTSVNAVGGVASAGAYAPTAEGS